MSKVTGGGGFVIERLVRTFGVVELKVVGEAGVGLGGCPVRFQIDVFIFDGSPQSFGKDIVHTPASSVHADPNFFV